MIKQLAKAKHVDQRQDASKILGDLGAVEAVTALAGALIDTDSNVRREASYALARRQCTGRLAVILEGSYNAEVIRWLGMEAVARISPR